MANPVGFKAVMKYLSHGDHIVLVIVAIALVSMPVVRNALRVPQGFVLLMGEEDVAPF
jgi:hypothetical protein